MLTRRRTALTIAGLAVVAGAASIAATAGATTEPPSDSSPATSGADTSAEAEAALAELVAAAEDEGSLTIYSSQNLGPFQDLVAAFEAEYSDIDVEGVRMVDTEIIPRLEIELETGTEGADIVIMASPDWIEPQAQAGSFLDASASPQIAGLAEYDPDLYVHDGNYFEAGAALATVAWNTNEIPDGIESYTDLLDPAYADGRIGVVDPAIASVVVDFWWWLEEAFGEDYVVDLAAQSPRVYPGAQPMIEAMSSGEIAFATFASTSVLADSIAAGAPIDYTIDDAGVWGTRFYGFIPVSAANTSAAALFADFMLSPAGQEIVQENAGSVLPDIPGTLITNDEVRPVNFEALTPEAIAEYTAEWNSLFR